MNSKPLWITALFVFGLLSILTPLRAETTLETGGREALHRTNHNDLNGTTYVGGVFVSHTGKITLHWEGLTVNLGSYAVSATSEARSGFTGNVTFPSITIDLKKLFGATWDSELRMKLSSGGYDDNRIRSTTDLFIGRIALNLSQVAVKNEHIKLDIAESVGSSAFVSRYYQVTQKTAESIPLYINFDATLAATLSPALKATLALGLYNTYLAKLNGPNEDRIGSVASLSLEIDRRLVVGARIEAQERVVFNPSPKGVTVQDMLVSSGFIQYELTLPSNEIHHILELNGGQLYDESVPRREAANADYFIGLGYLVRF